jgi:hypothetical protein
MVPENPFGNDWVSGTGGDVVKVYAYINNTYMDGDGVHWIEFSYSFCNEITCIPREYAYMDYLGDDLFVFTFPGDTIKGWQEFSASHHSSSHVAFYIWADSYPNADVHATYPPACNPDIVGDGWAHFYPAWPPSRIDGAMSLSKTSCYPGETITVTGNAKYWNSTSLPKDLDPTMATRINCSGCFANVTMNGVTKMTKCDAEGDFSVQFTAPAVGTYPVTAVVTNGSANRNVPTNIAPLSLVVVSVPTVSAVTAQAAPQDLYPGKTAWVNGTATHSDATPVASSQVNITIAQTGAKWSTTTNSAGGYSKAITNPPAGGNYTVNVDVKSAAHGTTGSVQTYLRVAQPTLSVTLATSSTTSLPGNLLWANGTAAYGNGEPAAYEPVNVCVPGYSVNVTTTAAGTYSAVVSAPATTGIHQLNVSVWGAKYSVWGYGEVSIMVTAVPVPDMDATTGPYGLAPLEGHLLEGYNVSLYATVRNLGIADAQNFTVDIEMDGAALGSRESSMVVGGSANFSVTWMATAGNHTATFIVDGSNSVNESFEDNNNLSFEFFIDSDTDGDLVGNLVDDDDDGDGYDDTVEVAEGSDPLDAKDVPPDVDGDFIPDSTDGDIDGDGVPNAGDALPYDASETEDLDGDGIGDNADVDDDGDGVNDSIDAFPEDASEWTDTDGDGTGNNADEDIDGDGVPNGGDAFPLSSGEWSDIDGDGAGDNSDADVDGDGYLNDGDPRPFDTDNDGLDNWIDLDDDGDGLRDEADAMPLDTDNDGIGNAVDGDDDGDGVPDTQEDANWNGRVDPGETSGLNADTDGDGIDDADDPLPTGQADEAEAGPEATPGLMATLMLMLVIPALLLVAGLIVGKPR